MSPFDLLGALTGAFAHRTRAALTVIGVVIGSASIVLLASLLRGGATFLVHANQEASDDDVIELHRDEPPPAQRDRTTRPLSRADAAVVRESAALASALVEPESALSTHARYGSRKKRVAVVSTGSSTMSLYRLAVARGRALDVEDRARSGRVCVVGHEVYEELLRSAYPLESLRIEIDGHLFSVVGVLAKKPLLDATDSPHVWDRKVMIPETTYDALYAPSHDVSRIYVRAAKDEGRGVARATLHGVVLRRHFGVLNFALGKDESGGMERLILDVIQVLLLGTGMLALLASGINIMNVMLVSVSERRREIGLRRAFGATRRSVLVTFLLEAIGLSGAGASLGIATGAVLSWAAAQLARAVLGAWELEIPTWSLGLGMGLSVAIGLLFGIMPARRAAQVSPIDALRSE